VPPADVAAPVEVATDEPLTYKVAFPDPSETTTTSYACPLDGVKEEVVVVSVVPLWTSSCIAPDPATLTIKPRADKSLASVDDDLPIE